jgi:hypothetical protein
MEVLVAVLALCRRGNITLTETTLDLLGTVEAVDCSEVAFFATDVLDQLIV